MLNIKDKFTGLLLFLLGTAWGNWWTTEILSCPEWWFIGEVALLTGSGICIIRKLNGNWKVLLPALLLLPAMLMPSGDWQSVLVPFIFGMWYGSDDNLSSEWKPSRIFCGGLLLGGVLAGIIVPLPELSVAIVILSLLFAGIKISSSAFWEMVLLGAMTLFLIYPEAKTVSKPAKLEPGTVISAFSLVPAKASFRRPTISFTGGRESELQQHARELFPVSNMLFLPELAGTLPSKSDLIVVCGLSETGDSGAAAMLRSLNENGVLLFPVELCHILPDLSWHTLPGSAGKYAAASPGRVLNVDPDEMDKEFEKHFSRVPDLAPSAGILAGMLVDFKSEKITFPAKLKKNFTRHSCVAAIALIYLTAAALRRGRKSGLENFRIFVNCSGYTLLTAVTVPVIFAGLPTVASLRTLVTAMAVMWFFRRPYPRSKGFIWFAGLLAITALGATYINSWIFAISALVFGGYTFAVLDGELRGKESDFSDPLRFIAAAAGACAVYWLQKLELPYYILFSAAAILRGWSLLRN